MRRLPLHAKVVDKSALPEGLQNGLQLFVRAIQITDGQFKPVSRQITQPDLLALVGEVAHAHLLLVPRGSYKGTVQQD